MDAGVAVDAVVVAVVVVVVAVAVVIGGGGAVAGRGVMPFLSKPEMLLARFGGL